MSADLEPVQLVDLVATPSGAVVVLDSIGSRVLVLRPGDAALKTSVPIDAKEPTSVAAGGDDGIVYVAHGAGILRSTFRRAQPRTSKLRKPCGSATSNGFAGTVTD